jgi:hypothetical protein
MSTAQLQLPTANTSPIIISELSCSASLYLSTSFLPPYCQNGRRASEISTAQLQLPTLDPFSSESHVVIRRSAFCIDELGIAEIMQD